MKSILDRSFKYTPSAQTSAEYLRAKFRKIMREQEKAKAPVTQLRKTHQR